MGHSPISGGLPHDKESSHCLKSKHHTLYFSFWFKGKKKKQSKTSSFIDDRAFQPPSLIYPQNVLVSSFNFSL